MAQLSTTALANDSGLRAYWTFNSGSLASSVNGYTLTNQNSVTFPTGKYLEGAALGASNTNKAMNVNSDLSINNKIMSLVCWVKLQSEIGSGGWSILEHVSNTSDCFFALSYEYNSGNRLLNAQMYRIAEGGDTNVKASHSVALGTSSWHHLAAVSDGTNFRLYLDGTQRASATCPSNGNFNIDNRFNVGYNHIPTGAQSGPNAYASAIIDDIAVFNRALTAGEVAQLASDGGNSGFFAIFD